MRNKLGKWDFLIPAAALAVALLLFAFLRSEDTGRAEIIIDGQTVYSADLSSEEDKTLNFGEIGIEIRNGEIGFVSSPCAGRDCIRTGFISHPGEAAVCIPEKAVIRITGRSKSAPDAISY